MIDRFLKALSVYELSFVEFTPWEHNGNYGPFGLQNGGLAIPVNMIRSLYEDLIKLDKTDIILKGLLILNPSCYTCKCNLNKGGICANAWSKTDYAPSKNTGLRLLSCPSMRLSQLFGLTDIGCEVELWMKWMIFKFATLLPPNIRETTLAGFLEVES
jgi:hypothetical protein